MNKVLFAIALLIVGIPAQAVPITIETDADLVAAHQSLTGSEDIFIQSIESASQQTNSGILEALFTVLNEATTTFSSDLDYFMGQLKERNDISDAMTDYLRDLVNNSSELQDRLAGAYRTELGVDAGFETTSDQLLLALFDADSDTPIAIVGDATSNDTGGVNALMRSYGIPIVYTTTPVPEPTILALLSLGFIGIIAFKRKSWKS